MQGSARKDVVFGAARVYTVAVPGSKWKSWLKRWSVTKRFKTAYNRATVRSKEKANKQPTAIDLFAGCGGLSEGFRQAGFRVLVANDFDPRASETYRACHSDTRFIEAPIETVDADDLLSAAGLAPGELHVLLGGPPCQAFSVYNHQRGMHDQRSGLFREYIRLIAGVMPHFVVMENVTGITSVANGRAVSEIYSSLTKLGYTVEHRTLRAEDYGVPQERRRIVFVASRTAESLRWPEPTHRSIAKPIELFPQDRRPFNTVWDAIGDLPALGVQDGSEETPYPGPHESEYQRLLRDGSPAVYNHVAPALAQVNRERLKYIPQGGSWRDIPHRLLPAGMKRAKRSDHTKRYGRLKPAGLACTILTKCDLHWGAYIHPTQERTLTVREAARLQSFPDRIRFRGPRVEQFRQVGNAVPPLLGLAIAEKIRLMIAEAGKRELAVAL